MPITQRALKKGLSFNVSSDIYSQKYKLSVTKEMRRQWTLKSRRLRIRFGFQKLPYLRQGERHDE